MFGGSKFLDQIRSKDLTVSRACCIFHRVGDRVGSRTTAAMKASLLLEALASTGRPLSLSMFKRLVEFASRPMILHQVSTIAPSLGQTESSLHGQFLDGM